MLSTACCCDSIAVSRCTSASETAIFALRWRAMASSWAMRKSRNAMNSSGELLRQVGFRHGFGFQVQRRVRYWDGYGFGFRFLHRHGIMYCPAWMRRPVRLVR